MAEAIDTQLIPKHWQIKKLGEVCTKISLNKIKIKQKDYLVEGKYPVVDQGQELIGGYYDDEKLVIPNEPPFVIFGDHTKVKKFINFKFIAGADGVKVLKPNSILDSKFFFYLIHTVKIPDKGYARHFQFLEKEYIPIPPLPEQQLIVSKIEELLSDLENGKQQFQLAQQQLKIYRQSLLKWAFEGKLTNKKVKDGELPERWKWVTLGKIIEKPQYGTSKKCDYNTNGIGVLRIPNIGNGVIDSADLKYGLFDQTEIDNYKLKEGDILTIRSNGSVDLVGKCALIKKIDTDFLFAGYLIKLRPNHSLIKSEYLLNILSSHSLRNQIEFKAKSTSGVNNINSEELKSLIIPLCPIEEQQLIVDELESKLTVCEKIEETISQSLLQAESLKQSILKKAFEGKLV
jgi:type I restriction enzyme, S subunit